MRVFRRTTIAGLALAMLIAAGNSLGVASTFLKMDVPGLTRSSEKVVHARVVDIRSAWNSERSMIFTHVTLEVIRTIHGASEDRIVVRVPGGTVGGFTAEMEGAPRFRINDEVVAFISRWRDGAPMVAGYFQGVSRVVPDRAGNPILHGGAADGLPISELARQLGQSGR